MTIEAALVKPVVDALMGLFRQGHDLTLKHNAEAALREAIRELLLANPDENKAAARIAIAKAAGLDQTLAGPGPYTVFVPDDAAFGRAPAGVFDIDPKNRPQLTGILTNLVLPGTVMASDIGKAIDAGNGKAMLATMGGGTLTATKDGGKTVLTDAAGHKATITQADEQYTNGVVHHVDAVLMPSKKSAPLAVGQKAGK